MKIEIREADLQQDRQQIIEAIRMYLTDGSDDKRYDWLYLSNPHGRARTWFAEDEANGNLVGLASSFPRRVFLDGKRETVWVLGDFCINSSYRSLGPAIALQKACMRLAAEATNTFCYDFPNSGMAAVYRRIGVEPLGDMIRLALPLGVERLVEKKVKSKALARGLALVGNAALALTRPRAKSSQGLEVASHQGPCGREFSELAERVESSHGVCVERSAEYLNWRYLAAPLNRFEISTIRDGSSLRAYAVYEQRESNARIADLFGLADPTAMRLLVDRVVELLKTRGVVNVNMPMLKSHPWLPWMRELGFRPREAAPVFAYAPEQSSWSPANKEWFLMSGDRDS